MILGIEIFIGLMLIGGLIVKHRPIMTIPEFLFVLITSLPLMLIVFAWAYVVELFKGKRT